LIGMVLAAGAGRRLRPDTDALPKALLPVDGQVTILDIALRNLAAAYPYEAHQDGVKSLRANMAEVAQHLKEEIQERLAVAGVEVKEARISHLAYAPEIAAAMLQRQQASAIVAARTRIVDGAVGMVEMALERLDQKGTVHLDEERKAAMVSNLMVVLCGDQPASPIVNAGSLYT